MTKLFVGGLTYSINNQALNDLFSQYGNVTSATVIMDKFTNQSKGFGFVEMADDTSAQNAINKLNGTSFEGRTLGVSIAKPREDRPRSNFGQNGRHSNSSNGNRDNRNYFKRGGR